VIPTRIPGTASVVAGLVAFAVAALTVCRVLTPDGYLSLYSGRFIDEHGIPHHDPFTAAGAGRTWIDQQWLVHRVAFGLWQMGGYRAIGLACAVAYGFSIALLALAIRRRGIASGPALVAVAPAAVVILTHVQIWPEAFALPLFMGVLLILLEQERMPRMSRHALWVLPILVVWANVHGSVLLGAALASGYAGWRMARDRVSRTAVTLLVAAPASILATPYGWDTAIYYRSVLGSSAIRHEVPIWRHASISDFYSLEFFVLIAVTAAVLGVAARRGHRPDRLVLVLALVLLAAGIDAVRDQTWFCFPQAVLLAGGLGAAWSRSVLTEGGWRLLAVLSVLAASAAVVVQLRTEDRYYERLAPTGATRVIARYAAAHPTGRVLADFSTADALLWHEPRLAGRVAFDTRLEIFQPAQVRRWLRFNDASPGWQSFAAGYALVAASGHIHGHLVRAVRSDRGLVILYDRGNDIVAARRSP
jgi:hypothetical protein